MSCRVVHVRPSSGVNHCSTWFHLPIVDGSVPDAAFEAAWADTGVAVRALLASGANVLFHCLGGLGRSGTIAARTLVECGWPSADAIAAVRATR